MKTVLAPIDFSDVSTNALFFAAELSKRASVHLVIIHVISKEEDEDAALQKLRSAESNVKTFFGTAFRCESTLVHGGFVSAVNKTAAGYEADLMVMGTRGASGLKKFLIGSNTVNVLANTRLPVLVIPEAAKFENFLDKGKGRIILASDLDELENESALDILKEIALLIKQPKVRVVSVRPDNTHLPDFQNLQRDFLLSVFRPDIDSERITVFSDNVISGINFYLNKHDDTGLIAMIARDTGHLIQKHYTREMASHSDYPLLVMHDSK
jgi:nucleotide-binding universal stress UspA family protein